MKNLIELLGVSYIAWAICRTIGGGYFIYLSYSETGVYTCIILFLLLIFTEAQSMLNRAQNLLNQSHGDLLDHFIGRNHDL